MTDQSMVVDMLDVGQHVARIQMKAIEDYAGAAAGKGKVLAVSPMALGEVGEDSENPRAWRFSVKTDTMLLNPNDPAPAGWTVYDIRKDSNDGR